MSDIIVTILVCSCSCFDTAGLVIVIITSLLLLHHLYYILVYITYWCILHTGVYYILVYITYWCICLQLILYSVTRLQRHVTCGVGEVSDEPLGSLAHCASILPQQLLIITELLR